MTRTNKITVSRVRIPGTVYGVSLNGATLGTVRKADGGWRLCPVFRGALDFDAFIVDGTRKEAIDTLVAMGA